jgi:hypothetical protein
MMRLLFSIPCVFLQNILLAELHFGDWEVRQPDLEFYDKDLTFAGLSKLNLKTLRM